MIKDSLAKKILSILKLLILNTIVVLLILTIVNSNTNTATIIDTTNTDEENQIVEEQIEEEVKEEIIQENEETSEEKIVEEETIIETADPKPEIKEEPKPVEVVTTTRSQEEVRVEKLQVVETPKTYKLTFSSGSVDRSCYQQSGYLNSNNLCIWAGKGNTGDGQASYYCAHDFTSWGRAINSLYSGDLVLIDNTEYKVINSTLVARHGDHGAYATNAIYDCFEYNGDRAYFQTCVNDTQMVIKECIPVK